MAKLKARGRQEIARMAKDVVERPDSGFTDGKKYAALMSDGNILTRQTARWTDTGERHDWGWKVAGKIKPGLTAEDFIRIYQEQGYTLESHSPSFLIRRGGTIENVSKTPIRKEPARKTTRAPRTSSKETESLHDERLRRYLARGYKTDPPGQIRESGLRGRLSEGSGLYVTNVESNERYAQEYNSPRAVAYGPFEDLELAEQAAWMRLRELEEAGLRELMPVEIVKSKSFDAAERGHGYVWWTDGKRKGPPIDPRQQAFTNF